MSVSAVFTENHPLRLSYLGRNNTKAGTIRSDLLHAHDIWSLDLCCKGENIVQIQNSHFSFKQGDILLIPPYLQHRFIYRGKAFVCYSLKFEMPAIPSTVCKSYIHDKQESRSRARKGMIEAVRQCIESFFPKELWEKPHEFFPPQAIHEMKILEDFLYGIVSFYIAEEQHTQAPDLKNQLLTKVHEYVSIHSGRAVTVQDLAKHLHYSPRYFRTLVSQICGENPKIIIDKIRIQIIQNALGYSGLRFKELADNMGFQDARYFTRFFKKYTGCNPREWLRRNREKSCKPKAEK